MARFSKAWIGFAFVYGFVWLVDSAHADNWPTWRGPTRGGISNEKRLPTERLHAGESVRTKPTRVFIVPVIVRRQCTPTATST